MKTSNISLQKVRQRRRSLTHEAQKLERQISRDMQQTFAAPDAPQVGMQKWIYKAQRIASIADTLWAGYKLVKKFRATTKPVGRQK